MSQQSQWKLLSKSHFAPLFWTQFLGAFNDNLYKNALLMLLGFNAALLPQNMSSSMAVNICAGLFILPFFLFSAWAGELADKNEKSQMIRWLKVWEIMIIGIGIGGLFFQNVYLMWGALFGLGVQSAFFGPLKYSILPQHLKENELIGGNALIESGTFIAILLGTILGGVLIAMDSGWAWVSVSALITALVGWYASTKIPTASAVAPDLKVGFNIIKQSINTIKEAKKVRSVYLSILGISWFWFFGATLLTQFPALVKDVLLADKVVVTLLLALFSVGIGVGSILCEKLSGSKVEIGLVPFGAIGMTLFCLDFYFALDGFAPVSTSSITQFLNQDGAYRIVLDLMALSVFGGFFIVPLYALIQSRSEASVRSRIIAANNIMNALFMVVSAIAGIVALSMLNMTLPQLILALACVNALVAVYIFTLVPEFLMRFIVWLLIHTVYKIRKNNVNSLPEDGAAILVCNHVSFMDAIMIFGLSPRPVKFVMYYKIFNIPFFKYMFSAIGAIPIASKKEDPVVLENAYKKMEEYLNNGEIVVIFPEGAITKDGDVAQFKPGILKVLENCPVPVIPSALSGLWGSMFSRKDQSVWRYIPKGFFGGTVSYNVGTAIAPSDVTIEKLHHEVSILRGDTK